MSFRLAAFGVLAIASVSLGGHAPAADSIVAFTHVRLIDGTGAAAQPDMTVLVVGRRITQIGPSAAIHLPPGTHEYPMRGSSLMPGLIDSHVHLASIIKPDAITRKLLGFAFLGGVTTVRDMGGRVDLIKPLATASRADTMPWPRISYSAIMAGPGRWFDGERGREMAGAFAVGESPTVRMVGASTDVARVVDDAIKAGASGIKIYNAVSPELMRRLSGEAHRRGLRVWSHFAVSPARPSAALAAHVDVVSHADGFVAEVGQPLRDNASEAERVALRTTGYLAVKPDTAPIRAMMEVMRRQGTILDATLFIMTPYAGTPGDSIARASGRYSAAFHSAAAMTAQAHRLGVAVSAGTDALGGSTPNIHAELQLLVDSAGFTPLEAIRSATLIGARTLGVEDSLGTVAIGKVADLVILRADPSADIRNTQTVSMVVKGGRVYERRGPWRSGPMTRPPAANR